jgi:hypothetical protein
MACKDDCGCKKDFKPASEGEKHVCCADKPKAAEEKKGCGHACGCGPKPGQ